jgi:hypothetical protein
VATREECNSAATNETLGHYNPSVTTIGGGNSSFNGLNFSGVSGAILGCNNIGESITTSVSSLFKKAKDKAQQDKEETGSDGKPISKRAIPGAGGGVSGGEQAVTDAKALEQLKKQQQRENCLNGVAYAVAKNLLQQVASKTMNWINTGLDGNPFYVRDIDSYLNNIKNEKVSAFLNQIPNDDPVFGYAVKSVITQQVTGRSDGLLTKVMNTPQAQAYQNFQNDFTQGGWSAFLNMNNNALGAYFKATDRLSNDINTAEQNTKDEIAAGNGFLNMKKCVEYEKPATPPTPTPTSCSYIFPSNYASCCTAPGASTVNARQCNAYTGGYQGPVPAGTTSTTSVVTTIPRCIRYETVTPGSVIAAQAAIVTTTSVRQLEQADQINEVLGAFFDQQLNRLFSTGLGGLTGAQNGSGTNIIYDSQGNVIPSINQGAADAAFGYQSVSGGFNGDFDISRPQQLRAIIKTQMDFVNATKDAQAPMARIIPTLGKLDYCVPGPNPTWKVGTNYNAGLFFSALAGKAPSQAIGNTISSISSTAGAFATGSIVGAPAGLVIAAVGNVVGGLINVFGGNTPVSVSATSLQLFDKVTNGAQEMSDFKLNRKKFFDNISLVDALSVGYDALISDYTTLFDPTSIHDRFVRANPGNASNDGIIADIMDETNNLIYYNQSIASFNQQNTENINETEDAIAKLNAIRDESEVIVARAKDRYIKEMAAKGTPVTINTTDYVDPDTGKKVHDPAYPARVERYVQVRCIDQAYAVTEDPSRAPAAPRPLKDITPSPRRAIIETAAEKQKALDMIKKSNDASTYFYTHL